MDSGSMMSVWLMVDGCVCGGGGRAARGPQARAGSRFDWLGPCPHLLYSREGVICDYIHRFMAETRNQNFYPRVRILHTCFPYASWTDHVAFYHVKGNALLNAANSFPRHMQTKHHETTPCPIDTLLTSLARQSISKDLGYQIKILF